MKKKQHLSPDDFVPMDMFVNDFPVRIDLAYARADNLLLGEAVYKPDARLWLFRDLADVVLEASRLCFDRHGHYVVLYDGLRTIEAQALMLETKRVKDNPQWLEEPRLLSPPGAGAHPRGMAIDLSLQTPEGRDVDMGTPFDYLALSPDAESNPAHRSHPDLGEDVQANRRALDSCMMEAAQAKGVQLYLLPQEWWDFRLKLSIYSQYYPLSESDLPIDMHVSFSA